MKTIGFRVSEAEKAQIETISGGNVSAYCREAVMAKISKDQKFDVLLDRQEGTDRQLSEIMRLLTSGVKTQGGTDGSGLPVELISCIFESLYLLRLVATNAQREQAKSAIERLSLPYIYNTHISELAERKNRTGK